MSEGHTTYNVLWFLDGAHSLRIGERPTNREALLLAAEAFKGERPARRGREACTIEIYGPGGTHSMYGRGDPERTLPYCTD